MSEACFNACLCQHEPQQAHSATLVLLNEPNLSQQIYWRRDNEALDANANSTAALLQSLESSARNKQLVSDRPSVCPCVRSFVRSFVLSSVCEWFTS